MKKISLLLIILLFAVGASGGYGYYAYVLNEDDAGSDGEDQAEGNSAPSAKIDPSNPKIQVNSNINFTASKSTDPDNDERMHSHEELGHFVPRTEQEGLLYDH